MRGLARRRGLLSLVPRGPLRPDGLRRPSPGEPPRFEPLELLGDGLLDDRGQVAVGHRGAHESPEPLELVVELGGGGELDLVAGRGRGSTVAGRATAGDSGPGTPGVALGAGQLRLDGVRARRDSVRTGAREPGPAPRGPSWAAVGWGKVPAVAARAASASPPEHRDGAPARRPAPRSRASTCASARSRSASRFSGVRCGASFAIAVRCSRPSASISRRTGAPVRRGRRRCGGRPRPRRGGGRSVQYANIDGEASRA